MPVLTHRQILTVLTGLMLGMLVAALSQTIVATALPTIVGDLGGQNELAWVVSATLLTSTASTPIWGKLSDLYGRKIMFQSAIGLFLVASLGAGFAQNMGQLIGIRAVQGLGVGGLMALSQAIIGDVVSPRERGRYQGYIGSVFGLATVAGPLLGGFLVEHLSWRWTFWVGIPVGIAALVVTERVLRFPFPRRQHAIDWLGAFFIVASVGTLLLMLSLAGKNFAWNSAWTYGLVAVSLLMLAAAIWQERRAAEPIMPPHLFRNHTFVITSLAGLIVGVAMFGAIIFLPQYLQIVKGESPTVSGLLTLPLVIGLLITSIGSGLIITRTGRYKIFPIVGLLVAAAGLALLSRLQVHTSLVVASGYMLVTGLGIGMVMQVLVLAAQNAVGQRDLGVATSGATFFRSMGGAIGVAVFGALLSHRLVSTIPAALARVGVPPSQLAKVGAGANSATPAQIGALPEPIHTAVITGFAEAIQTAFLAAVPFALAGFIVVLFLREHPLRQHALTAPPSEDAAPVADEAAR
jgi:EmrB/QacA subfamily drug resistance transporter